MKVLQVLGLVLLVGVLSAFSWGNRSKSDETSSSSSSAPSSGVQKSSSQMDARSELSTAAPAARYTSEVKSGSVSSKESSNAAASTAGRSATAAATTVNRKAAAVSEAPATATAGAAGFPSELISALAQGDEETRRARIESLKRLSQALAQVRSQQTPSQAVVEQPAEKSSGSRWGR